MPNMPSQGHKEAPAQDLSLLNVLCQDDCDMFYFGLFESITTLVLLLGTISGLLIFVLLLLFEYGYSGSFITSN